MEYGSLRSPVRREKPRVDYAMPLLFVVFLIGAALGRWNAHCFSNAVVIYGSSFPLSMWRGLQFHAAVALSLFSSAGTLLVPTLMLLRGYTFSCTSALVWHSGDVTDICRCFIPALLQLPSMYFLCAFAWRTSLGKFRHNAYIGSTAHRNEFMRCVLFTLVGILLSTIAEYRLL